MSRSPRPSYALMALRRGEISVRSYLADRIQHALSPFEDALTKRQLQWVAKIIRARLRLDPVLRSYIERLRVGPPRGSTPPSRPGGVG